MRRDHILRVCLSRTPRVARLAHLAYFKDSIVLASGHAIQSSSGVQQGDPLGPLLFALAVDETARSVSTELN